MQKFFSAAKRCAVTAGICIAVLLGGCSYTVVPKSVPPVKGFETVSLKDVSLLIANADKDVTEFVVPTDAGKKSSVRTNRQAWSTLLVETLAGELAKRGATVSSKASLTLTISLPEITFTQKKDESQFRVKAVVTSSTGWTKTFEGMAQSERAGLESVTTLANRLAGQSLSNAVKAMLGDEEFLKQVGMGKP